MKKVLLVFLLILFLLTACAEKTEEYTHTELTETRTFGIHWGDVERMIDNEAGVVCWVHTGRTTNGSIFCLPIENTLLTNN